MAKKEERKQPETTQEETVTPEQEAPAPEQTPETPAEPKEEKNPFEEKYNAEHDSYLRLAAGSKLSPGAPKISTPRPVKIFTSSFMVSSTRP